LYQVYLTLSNFSTQFVSLLTCKKQLNQRYITLTYIQQNLQMEPLKRRIGKVTIFHVFSIGLSSLLNFILFIYPEDFYSTQGGFCWISASSPILRFSTFYVWAVLTFIVNLLIFLILSFKLIFIRLCKSNYFNLKLYLKNLSGKVLLYSFIFVLCWFPGTLLRFIQIFSPTFSTPYINFPHTFLINFQTFLISIVFIFCENLYDEYKCHIVFCCCCRFIKKRSRKFKSFKSSIENDDL
jgi:hypothetical protein